MILLKGLCFLFLTNLAYGAEKADLSLKLMDLRSQIQQEADQLEAEKLRLNASLQSLTVQKGELASQRDLFEMRKKEMIKSLESKKQASHGEDPKAYAGQSKKIDQALDELMNYYKRSVPFKVDERLGEVRKIKTKKENKELTVAEYSEAYWSILQREIRFSESIEIQKGFVSIDGEKFEVDLLRLGMLGLYFKTRSGDYGYYAQNSASKAWQAKWIEDSNFTNSLSEVFLARTQGITDGVYTMPLFIKEVSNVL